MVFVNVAERRTAREEAAQMFAGQYGLPLETFERWCLLGSVDDVAEGLAELREAGVDGFVRVPASPDPVGQYERLAEVRVLVERSS